MKLTEIKSKSFKNGKVYLLNTSDGYPIETTDTFLPYYTKDSVTMNQNMLQSDDLGSRTESNLKTTLNLTMARQEDFSIEEMKRLFDKDYFFVKISPINENDCSIANSMGAGIIEQQNLI